MGTKELTPSGLRQRYLLGRQNRQRYIDEYKFLDSAYNPSEFEAVSTDIHRTLHSIYAELVGFYPPEFNDKWIVS